MSLPNCWYQLSLLNCNFYLITKMSLPNCRYQTVKSYIGTFVNLPNCHYQIVAAKLSLPNCRYLIVTLPNWHLTKLSLPYCHCQIVITKVTLPKIRPSTVHSRYTQVVIVQSMAWSISIQDFMRKVNYDSNFTESPCPTSFPFLTFIFLLEILSYDNPDFYFFFLAGVLE